MTADPPTTMPGATPTTARQARTWTTIANGAQVRVLRLQHRLTRRDLASRAGVSPATIARIERQPRASCRGRTLARVAAALGTDPAAIAAAPADRP